MLKYIKYTDKTGELKIKVVSDTSLFQLKAVEANKGHCLSFENLQYVLLGNTFTHPVGTEQH